MERNLETSLPKGALELSTSSPMSTRAFRLLQVLLLAVVSLCPASGQQAEIDGINSVPEHSRATLLGRLKTLVGSYQLADWPTVHKSLPQFPPVTETLGDFQARLSRSYPRSIGGTFVNFEPDTIVEQPANQWAVWGCATLKNQAQKAIKERWVVFASWEREEWFFSELRPVANLGAKKPLPCKSGQGKIGKPQHEMEHAIKPEPAKPK
jgi:hypothetical protein